MCEYNAGDFQSWKDIVRALDTHYGVITCTMEALRDIDGYGRLGGTVRQNIHRKLSSLGISTIRQELPTEASAPVILIRQGTPVTELLEIITMTLAGGGVMTDTAESLRRLNMLPDPKGVRDSINAAIGALDQAATMVKVDG